MLRSREKSIVKSVHTWSAEHPVQECRHRRTSNRQVGIGGIQVLGCSVRARARHSHAANVGLAWKALESRVISVPFGFKPISTKQYQPEGRRNNLGRPHWQSSVKAWSRSSASLEDLLVACLFNNLFKNTRSACLIDKNIKHFQWILNYFW